MSSGYILQSEGVRYVFRVVVMEPAAFDETIFELFVGSSQDGAGVPELLAFAEYAGSQYGNGSVEWFAYHSEHPQVFDHAFPCAVRPCPMIPLPIVFVVNFDGQGDV